MPTKLSIDIETYSSHNLADTGVYKYVEAADFAVILFAYAFDGEPVQVVDVANGEQLPGRVLDALSGWDDTELHAHNAAFERICINKHYGLDTQPEQWYCTMVQAANLGLPMKLDSVAKVLKLSDQKDTEGKALIRYFCVPCKPTKANGYRTRNLPEHAPEKWAKFIEYCRQDVVVEREIRNKIDWFTQPATERELWCLDQRINDRGVLLDVPFVTNAIRIDAEYTARLRAEAIEITGLENPNSGAQVIRWLDSEGVTTEKLTKDAVTTLLANDNPAHVDRLLTIRQEMAKTSNKKYTTMLDYVCADGRVRGMFQFYGAGGTGRWAGRGPQPQNLPKNKIENAEVEGVMINDLDTARQLVADGDGELLELLYGNVPDTLSQLLRTAFVAPKGKTLTVADAAAIEARILSWLAGAEDRLEVFRTHGKIYEASAAKMYNIPFDTIVKGHQNYQYRGKGKVGELALGYGGGEGAIESMEVSQRIPVAERTPKKERQVIVRSWRAANPSIPKLWKVVETAAIVAVETGVPQVVLPGLRFFTTRGVLFIRLPSGRYLSYMRPQIKTTLKRFITLIQDHDRYSAGQKIPLPVSVAGAWVSEGWAQFDGSAFESKSLTFEGVNGTTKQWQRESTYGGSIIENIVQGIARDCLAAALLAVDKAGHDVVMHVHDELVCDTLESADVLIEIEGIMSTPLTWAPGLPLGADGFTSKYYHK